MEYSYDPQGRMKTMKTWQNFVGNSGTATTTWNYNAYRGWLDSKRYPDAKGPDYTYKPSGRLEKRKWWRMYAGNRLETTYSYDNGGSQAAIDYADATPDVAFNYDRRGRRTSAVQAGMTNAFVLHDAGPVLSESYAGGTLGGYTLTNTLDSYLRRATFTAKTTSSTLLAYSYSYDTASRLSGVSDGTYSASYAYLANSPLLEQTTFKQGSTTRMATKRRYDNLNRLLSIASGDSATVVAHTAHAYDLNSANQRVRMTLADGTYWAYDYDALGQVKSGKHYLSDGTLVPGQQFEYGFDDIGNRTGTKAGGDASGADLRVATYTPNTLNQYTQRTVPRYLDVQGLGSFNVPVSVNGQPAYRNGEFYRKELDLTGNNEAVWQAVTNAVTGGTSQTGHLFLPRTLESYTYDDDGNLLSDGRWTTLVWDAENRLIEQRRDIAPDGARLKVTHGYDWQGRRIRKTTYTWNVYGWVLATDIKILYDGWNPVAEIDALMGGNLKRTFVWGLDLSGSLQGAGGVGGLLKETDYTFGMTHHFAAYDGNGNVTALVNATDSTITARYEYDPFGKPLRATGSQARKNPIRFSSKWQDEESGWLYYGYRFYEPGAGRWVSRDPIAESGFNLLAPIEDAELKLKEGRALYAFVSNNPRSFVDKNGLYNVKKCNVQIIVGHNTNPDVTNITNEGCSAASVIACDADSRASIGTPIPGVDLNEGSPNLATAGTLALAQFAIAKRHALSLCSKSRCGCICPEIRVEIVCNISFFERAAMPAGVCGKTFTQKCRY